MSVAAADGDGYGVLCVCVQSSEPRIVGECAAGGSQVVDQFGGLRGTGELAGLSRMVLGVFVADEQDRQRSQVGHDLVLPDIDVLRPGGAGLGGAGVAVAAPVGRAAVRPR